MATVEQVDAILAELLHRLTDVDDDTRALLPSRRTLEARCPDLDLVRYAEWQRGTLRPLSSPPPRRADIRIAVDSDTLVALHEGETTFSRAYANNRIRLDAPVTDLLRLRALL